MSHELEVKDGEASFVFNKTYGDPWHKLGVAVEENLTIDKALELCRGDYTVTKEPLYVHFPNPEYDPDDEDSAPEIELLVPNKVATTRVSPITEQEEILGVVGDGYQVVQNKTVLEKAYAVVGADAGDSYVDTAGVLFDGKRFFSYVQLDDLIIDPTGINDKIERGLAVYSSHDGSIAVTYVFTDIRVVCKNTVTMAVNGAERVFRAKHTASVEDRMAEAQAILGVSTDWAEGFKKEAEKLLSVSYTDDRFDKVLGKVFPVASDATDRQKANNQAIRDSVRSTFANERNAPLVGKNGWAMYNAVVEYVDHHRDADTEERLIGTMDPRDKSWANVRKLKAQDAILSYA